MAALQNSITVRWQFNFVSTSTRNVVDYDLGLLDRDDLPAVITADNISRSRKQYVLSRCLLSDNHLVAPFVFLEAQKLGIVGQKTSVLNRLARTVQRGTWVRRR